MFSLVFTRELVLGASVSLPTALEEVEDRQNLSQVQLTLMAIEIIVRVMLRCVFVWVKPNALLRLDWALGLGNLEQTSLHGLHFTGGWSGRGPPAPPVTEAAPSWVLLLCCLSLCGLGGARGCDPQCAQVLSTQERTGHS